MRSIAQHPKKIVCCECVTHRLRDGLVLEMPRGRLRRFGREDLRPHQIKVLLSFSWQTGLHTPNLLLVLVASFTESSVPMVAKGIL
jgi:hypothetical protein